MSLPLERVNSSIGSAIQYIHDITTEKNKAFVNEFILNKLISSQAIIISYIESIRIGRRIKRTNNKRNRFMREKLLAKNNESESTKGEEEDDMAINFQELDV